VGPNVQAMGLKTTSCVFNPPFNQMVLVMAEVEVWLILNI